MTVSIHQPNFLPWLGYFHKMIHSDIFVFFDDIQYPRGKSFASRVLIKTPNGNQWITIPVRGRGNLVDVNSIAIDGTKWVHKTIRTINFNYNKTPYFNEFYGDLENIFNKKHTMLTDLNIDLINFIKEKLFISTRFVRSSEICKGKKLSTEDKIIYILNELEATHYISGTGTGSRRYIDESKIEENGIKLIWQYFNHPNYPQLFGEFMPNLSIIDLIFNCGKEESLRILKETKLDIN